MLRDSHKLHHNLMCLNIKICLKYFARRIKKDIEFVKVARHKTVLTLKCKVLLILR